MNILSHKILFLVMKSNESELVGVADLLYMFVFGKVTGEMKVARFYSSQINSGHEK